MSTTVEQDFELMVRRRMKSTGESHDEAERFLKQHFKGGAASNETPAAKWHRLLADQIAAGKSKAEAVKTLRARYPRLHHDVLVAGQGNAITRKIARKLPVGPEPTGGPIGRFNDLVATHEASGLTHRAAVARAAKEDPALHRRFLQATNQHTTIQR